MGLPRNIKVKTSDAATILTLSTLVWPYAVILLSPAPSRMDPALSETAWTMGAGNWTVLRTVILSSVRLPLFGTTLLLSVVLLGACVAFTVFAAPSRHMTAVAMCQNVRSASLNAPFGATRAVIALVAAGICFTLDRLLNRWVAAQ